MGQKVNPHGLRVGVIKDWDSRWYAREDKVGDLIVEDYNIRKYLKNKLYAAGVAKIEIERSNGKVKININCSRTGVVIGKAGADIENLRKEMEAKLGKSVSLNIVEVRSPDLNAQLVAENIAQQLEKRVSFRRAMKKAMQQATRLGAKGIKVTCGGRLGGAEIACFIARRKEIRFSSCAAMFSATSCAFRSGLRTSTMLRATVLPSFCSMDLRSFSMSSPPLPMMTPGREQWMLILTFALSLSISILAMPAAYSLFFKYLRML